MANSVEEKVEDWAKADLDKFGIRRFEKTTPINAEIAAALAAAPSKSGGAGLNYPDIQVFVETSRGRKIPVMIEVKGKKGDLAQVNVSGATVIENEKADGTPNYSVIKKFALNGAIHYATAIIRGTKSYKETIAIGVNGWVDASGGLHTELAVYYVSQDNFCVPKRIDDYSDFSFLQKKRLGELTDKIDSLGLTDEEKEKKTRDIENLIEVNLKTLNQTMRDKLDISENMRVSLVSGMIMAGLGVPDKVPPLDESELKGDTGSHSHDGCVIKNKIASFLDEKRLPSGKKEMILKVLDTPLLHSKLELPKNGESPLKTVYSFVQRNIMPYFFSKYHLDFTGRLFNVLNAWVKNPDGAKNDVVLTPRYVTDFMARLAEVDMDSYVWDYALGSAGFPISSMKLMVKDAEERLKGSPAQRDAKIAHIKAEQLLGIEKLPEIYLLAVLNMILMQDGSANIIHANSLTEYDGKYGQGTRKGEDFPADVFLLNPPYSAEGKGFVFVEKALSRMRKGRAAILIQENAGSGEGLPYTADILKHSTLLASIHMADIFKGKASVRTAVYVFEVGKPHKKENIVRFIDFDNDGYVRQNRKKSGLNVNLRDADHARERYEAVVKIALHGAKYLTPYFGEEHYIEDTIAVEGPDCGKDWTFAQHRRIDTQAKLEDFQKVVQEYLSWKVGTIIKAEGVPGKPQARA
jgi:type I restriction-modification system DNA methylase subunit